MFKAALVDAAQGSAADIVAAHLATASHPPWAILLASLNSSSLTLHLKASGGGFPCPGLPSPSPPPWLTQTPGEHPTQHQQTQPATAEGHGSGQRPGGPGRRLFLLDLAFSAVPS
jgi:hypothetical protein